MAKKIPPEHYFIIEDGSVIKNLRQLSNSLKKMSDKIFKHHVTKDRNDFYNWVLHIVKDKELAKKIKKERDKLKMSSIIAKKLSEKKKKKKVMEERKIKTPKKIPQNSKNNMLNKISKAFYNG